MKTPISEAERNQTPIADMRKFEEPPKTLLLYPDGSLSNTDNVPVTERLEALHALIVKERPALLGQPVPVNVVAQTHLAGLWRMWADYKNGKLVPALDSAHPVVMWERNTFFGPPPEGYCSWYDWCVAQTKTGVYIRAMTTDDSAHPAPKEGETPICDDAKRNVSAGYGGADFFWAVPLQVARSLELRLAEKGREVVSLQEELGLKLAACDCAAMMDTEESHAKNKDVKPGNPSWSPAFDSVMRRTADCIALRTRLNEAERLLEDWTTRLDMNLESNTPFTLTTMKVLRDAIRTFLNPPKP